MKSNDVKQYYKKEYEINKISFAYFLYQGWSGVVSSLPTPFH